MAPVLGEGSRDSINPARYSNLLCRGKEIHDEASEVALGEVAYGKAKKAALGEAACGDVGEAMLSKAAHDEAREATSIKIHARTGTW